MAPARVLDALRAAPVVIVALALGGCVAPEPEAAAAVVSFGDSYTSGTGAAPNASYPARLAEALDRDVVNAGVHGETAKEALARFDRDVLAREPAVVVLAFGVNEAYRGYSAEEALEGLSNMTRRARDAGIRVVLVDAVPDEVGAAGARGGEERYQIFQARLDAGLKRIAEDHGAELVLEALDGVLSDPALRSDSLHPNAAGYAVLAERVRPAVERALGGGR